MNGLQEKGIPRNVVLKELKTRLGKDLTYGSGRIEQIDGLRLVTRPTLNIVGIRSEGSSTELLALTLRRKGWAIALFPGHIRIAVMPHVTAAHIDVFLEDLNDAVKKLKSRKGT